MRTGLLLNIAGAIGIAACTSPVETSNLYLASRSDHTVPELEGCKLAFTEISDRRRDPAVVGRIGPRVIHGPTDPVGWVRNVLTDLRDFGAQVSFPAAEPPSSGSLSASVTLLDVWVANTATTKTGNVLVQVRYSRDGVDLKEARYRGAESEVNWFNSEGEIQSMIDDALGQILSAMSADLTKLCAQPAESPGVAASVNAD
jgi:hypothetical protein